MIAETRDVWDPPDLSGRVAIVTGASKGVGRGIAEILAACGMKVYAVSRSGEYQVDLSQDDAIASFFDQVGDETGPRRPPGQQRGRIGDRRGP